MTLSAEDIKVLTLERKKREIDAIYSPMPNGKERERLYKKSWALHKQISALIYDATGNYRRDKRHLLSGGSFDLHLLDAKGEIQ